MAGLDPAIHRPLRSPDAARVFDALWHLRSGALLSRGPGYLLLEETGVPVLRSSVKNAASRPGHGLMLVMAGLDPAIHLFKNALCEV
jgi:hypothetical protein